MSIILKYILKNMKEKKLRSLLIIISLTLSVVILTLCLTLKDNVLAKYTEFLMKTTGTSDISLTKETLFEKLEIENISDTYSSVPYMIFNKDKINIIGVNIEDLQRNKMIKSAKQTNLEGNEVIISKQTAESKNIKVNDTINVWNTELKVVEIVEEYGLLIGETEEQPTYLTSINLANKIMYENSDEIIKSQLDENKTYIIGAYIDVLDDNINDAKENLKQIDSDFSVITIKANLEEALTQINALMIIMLIITILIAFYIISSILKLVLEERMSVIGTFRSIGASRRTTDLLLYFENSFYGIISSIIGIVIASLIMSSVTDSFISSGDLELTSKAGIRPLYILIVVLFTILIQVFITFFELRKNKNKSIKNIIFDTQDTKYKIKKGKIILGFVLIMVSIIIYLINNKYNFIMGLLPVVLVIIGFVMVIPVIIKLISKLLSILLKNRKTSYIACKNVADNKIVISSTILLFIIIAMTTMIYNMSVTITNTYEGFDKVTHYTMRVSLSGEEENYEYIKDIEGVNEAAFYYINMGYFEVEDVEKLFAFFGYDKQDNTIFKLYDSIKFNKEEADHLKDDEILLDEAFAIKNNYKIGDKIKINGQQFFDEDYYFTIKGYIDSTNTTSARTVGMIPKDMYNKLFKNNYKTILIDSNLPDEVMKENLKNGIKEDNVEIESYQEWIGSDKENTKQIMNIVYGVLLLGILLAMVGLVNNGLVAFVQRKKGFAVLNSTCMTKLQLFKMVLEENIFSFIIATIPGILLSVILNMYMEKMVNGMSMFINMAFEVKGVLILLGMIFVLTIIETIVPIIKIKKLNLIKEIKYE